MEKVSSRNLKNRLGHYLGLVRAGHSIQVTERGEVVAEIFPPAHAPAKGETAGRRLVRSGGPNNPSLYPTFRRLTPPGTAERLLDEERGER